MSKQHETKMLTCSCRPDDMGTCHYGSVTTQPITDTNVITFNDTIGLTSNPVTIPFREWEVRGVPSP